MESRLLSSGDNPVQSKHLIFGICGMSRLLVSIYAWSPNLLFRVSLNHIRLLLIWLLYFFEVDTEKCLTFDMVLSHSASAIQLVLLVEVRGCL